MTTLIYVGKFGITLWKSFGYACTIRHTRIRTNSLPWINRKIKEQMRLIDFYKEQAVKHRSQTHWNMYRKTRNELNLEMRLAKKKYFCDKINAWAETNNPPPPPNVFNK